ncbi:MAG: APC family permease [Pirellulales bacterium]
MPYSTPPNPQVETAPKRVLTLFDSTCIIVGIILGAGVYQNAPMIARGAESGWGVMGLWLVGGILSLCGALGYAELASAYPREGGDYVYLSRAYGRWAGFLFGWMQLAVVRPGDIAVMAFAFAMYARAIYDPMAGSDHSYTQQVYSALAITVLTVINIVGVSEGKWTQNVLMLAKVIGIVAIMVVAIAAPHAVAVAPSAEPFPFGVALIFVLFAYGGWNEMAYVAAEVKDSDRNIVRALLLGTGAVIVLYLMLNVAFLYTLGYAGLAGSKAVAADAVSVAFPNVAGQLVSAMVCISALGAVNGLIFTGARISFAVGKDHRAFRALGTWNAKTGTPVRALLVQGALAIALVLILGSFVDTVLYTASIVYLFYLATSLAVIVLRWREPEVRRPYRVTGYPVTTLVFCAVCVFLIYGAVKYKPGISAAAIGVMLLGLPIYWLTDRSRRYAAQLGCHENACE